MLAVERLDLQMNTFCMFVQIGALSEAAATNVAAEGALLEMDDLPMLHGVVLLYKAKVTNLTLERALALVLGANVCHEVVSPAKGSCTLATGVGSVRQGGGDDMVWKVCGIANVGGEGVWQTDS